MTMSLVCTSTNTISKQEHMATPSLHDQPFIDTTGNSDGQAPSFESDGWFYEVVLTEVYGTLEEGHRREAVFPANT